MFVANKKLPYPGRLIFFHMQKTAGQAVNAWLTSQLGSGCVSPNLDGQYTELIRRNGGRYSVISGHMRLGYGEPLDARYLHVTLLREPVDRVVSWMFYLLTPEVANSENGSLIEGAKRFIQSDGKDSTRWFLQSITNLFVSLLSVIGPTATKERGKALDAAFKALTYFDVVGLYEEMPRFLRDVAGLIQISAPAPIEVVNKTKQRPKVSEISDALRERIVELNKFDLMLYGMVKERLLARQSAAGWQSFSPPAESRWAKFDPPAGRSHTSTEVTFESIVQPCGTIVLQGQLLVFELVVQVHTKLSSPIVGIHIFDVDKRLVFGTNSGLLGRASEMDAPGRYKVCFTLVANFGVGSYTTGFALVDQTPDGDQELAWHDVLCTFDVKNANPALAALGPGPNPVPTVLTVTRYQKLQP